MNKKLELLKKYYIEAYSQDEVDEINDFFLSIGAVKGSNTPSIHYPYRYIDDFNRASGLMSEIDALIPITLEEAKALVEERGMNRKQFIQKWLGNPDRPYTDENRDEMYNDIDLLLGQEKTFPRKMYVSDYDPECAEKKERILLWENPFGNPKYKFTTVTGGMEDDFAAGKGYVTNLYRYAKEIEPENTQKQELLNKADELIQKANELKQQAEKL